MIETRFTRLLDATAPIQLAAMPGVSTLDLVTAVATADGVGMLPAPFLSPTTLGRVLDELREKCSGAFGVNFLAHS